jgi:mannitol-specific phosphotransferase system IIBC component
MRLRIGWTGWKIISDTSGGGVDGHATINRIVSMSCPVILVEPIPSSAKYNSLSWSRKPGPLLLI